MAVANPQQMNLAPSYDNILQGLRQQATIALNRPGGPLNSLAAGVGKGIGAAAIRNVENNQDVEKESKLKAIDLALKKQLEDYNKVKIGDSDIKALVDMEIPKDRAEQLRGISLTPEAREKLLMDIKQNFQKEKAMRELEANVGKPGYPTSAELQIMKATAENGEQAFANKTFQKSQLNLRPGKDEKSETGWSYFSIDGSTGQDINTGVAAPPPAGSSANTKEKRETALRAEFNKKVKALDYQRYSNAYQQALRAEEQGDEKSPATDSRLLFMWAKMNDPNGRLSDQDFKRSAAIGTYGDQIQMAVNKLEKGNVLSDSLRKTIIDEIKSNYEQMDLQLQQIEDEHRVLADSEDLDFEKTISPVRPKLKPKQKKRVSVMGPNGETGTIEEGDTLPQGWKLRGGS